MRKLLFVVAGGLMAAALAAAIVAWKEIRHLTPAEINRHITEAVKSQTGLDLVTGHLSVTVSYHVIVNLDSARLLNGNQTVAQFGRIRLTCGYRTLLFHHGLPFIAVSLDRPAVVLPVRSVTPGPMPVLDADSVRDLRRLLVRLSNVTRQIVMSTATVQDRSGRVLFDEAAVRAVHSRSAGAWRVRLEGLFKGVDLPNFKVGVSLVMAPEIDGAEIPFARGTFWFWDANLRDLATRGVSLRGVTQGNLSFLIRTDGMVMGQALTRTDGFELAAPFLAAPIQIDQLRLSARLLHSVYGLDVSQFLMSAQGRDLVRGAANVTPMPPDNLRIRARLAPFTVDAPELRAMLPRIGELPQWASIFRTISAGKIGIDEFALDTTLKELEAPTRKILLEETSLRATLGGLAFNIAGLPPVAELDGKLSYGGGLVRIGQSHASLGASTLNQINLSADLKRAWPDLPYEAKIAGDFDLGELFAAVRKRLPPAAAEPLSHVQNLRGTTAVEVELRGTLNDLDSGWMPQYRAVLRPRSVSVGVASAPSEVRLYGGAIVVSPGQIAIDNLDLAPRHGSLKASGIIARNPRGTWQVGKLTLQMRQINAEEWLPSLFAMDMMDVHAPASGDLTVAQVSDGTVHYRVDGNLALGPGQIKFAFLRSPILLTEPASVMLAGQGGELAITSGTLEGSPLRMTVAIDDVAKPLIRINAHAQRLDLEAISAVRLPWNPKPPVKIDNTAFEGHVEAQEATLARLRMKDLSAGFRRDGENWRVFDINADAMGGHLTMDLTGRRRDDWVHIITAARGVDMVALEALAGNQTVLTGHLSSQADLWADTNGDFFDTLTGSLSTSITDGVLLKFKLLSRMLSLVDVSEWLNANVPDPRVNGVPFKTITAHFFGERGNFETTDFMLDGPVMKITAAGKVNVAQSAMNVMVGMRPFQLLDTVFNHIPLIGTRLAQSQSGIVAAYFHVQGPIADPSVVPAPITSISHLVIKTLAIPINLLIPETVK